MCPFFGVELEVLQLLQQCMLHDMRHNGNATGCVPLTVGIRL